MSSDNEGNSEDERLDALAALERQCRLAMGLETEIIKANLVANSEHNDDDEEEDEWNGIQDDDDDNDDISDEETVLENHAPALVTVFSDPSSSRQRDSVRTIDNFMSSKIRNHIAPPDPKGKRKARADGEDAEEERHLEALDASLASMIRDLPSNTSSTSLLPQLTALPDPRITYKKDRARGGAPIDPKAPRTLKEKLYASRLERAQTRAKEEKEGGIITHRHNIGQGDFALTKKERRLQTGKEDQRRSKARGISGVVGKMKKGGAELRLSRDEIKRGAEGDWEGLSGANKRKRPSGPPAGKSKLKRK